MGSIPGLGRSPEGGSSKPLHYCFLKTPMDRGAWWATVHGVAKSHTGLNSHSHTHSMEYFSLLFATRCFGFLSTSVKNVMGILIEVKVLITQSCMTLCNPMDCSLPGSSVYGISQARTLEWIAISSSRGSSQPRDQTHVSCVSCIGKVDSLPLSHLGKPFTSL